MKKLSPILKKILYNFIKLNQPQESTTHLDNQLKGIEKDYRDLHESHLSKLNERLDKAATEQKDTLFEILSSVTDIRMNLEKGQVSSTEKDVKFEDAVKKIEESVDKVKKIEESVKKMIENNEEKKKGNYYSDILSIPIRGNL